MKSIQEIINESNSINHILSNVNDELIQKIVSRVNYNEKHKNSDPVFLCYTKELNWLKYEMIHDQLGSDLVGYFNEYISHDNDYDLLILGIFINGCYFPILDEICFNSILSLVK